MGNEKLVELPLSKGVRPRILAHEKLVQTAFVPRV